jgi:uncharacterized protein (TIGR03118 family)
MRLAALAVIAVAGVAVTAALALDGNGRGSEAFVVERLVSDGGVPARAHDRSLVNAWGLAAEPGGAWWTANEANDSSTVYSWRGRKQLLTVSVPGGPTGVAFNPGSGFRVAAHGRSDPARFVFACEDGTIRAWTPSVPTGWSKRSEVAVDEGAEAAVFRGIAFASDRLYATDFHNDRVVVLDRRWRRVRARGAFVDPRVPEWYAPFGIAAIDGHIFVTYVWRAPVDGNDAPSGGFVDEFDAKGKLLARVAQRGALNAPWGLALAPRSFGAYAGDLLVGNFGDGTIQAYRRTSRGWMHDGLLRNAAGQPIVLNGLWSIAADGDRLLFTSGPHAWRGATELGVHGLLGAIAPE